MFLGVALYGLLYPTAHMPGPLSKEHSYIGDRCEACHKPLTGDTESGCLSCHAPGEVANGWREHRRDQYNLTNESVARSGTFTTSLDEISLWVVVLALSGTVLGAGAAWEAWKRRRGTG